MTTTIKRFAFAAGLALAGLGAAGCGDDNGGGPPDFAQQQKQDLSMNLSDLAGVDQAGGGGDLAQQPDMGCYGNPMTHIEIINACTASKQLDKPTNPNLPFLDGGLLPPLP